MFARRTSRSTAGSRRAALALSVCFAISQALPALHYLVVDHELCAEHGEWMHLSTGTGVVDPHARNITSQFPEPTDSGCCAHEAPHAEKVAAAGDPEDSAHEHCPLLATCREPEASDRVDDCGPVGLADTPIVQPAARVLTPKFPLFRLAPKTSPPSSVA